MAFPLSLHLLKPSRLEMMVSVLLDCKEAAYLGASGQNYLRMKNEESMWSCAVMKNIFETSPG